jgi:hypothetical protein
MSTTYLSLVNSTLRRLREDEVSAVSNTAYSRMVGDFINDAKRIVEDSHEWSVLRNTVVVSTSSGTSEYTLSGAGPRIKVYSAINDTSNFFMNYESPNWFANAQYISGEVTSTPDSYTFSGVDSSDDSKVQVYPTPDAVYSLRFNILSRPVDLVNDTDTVIIPAAPIIHLAIALLARERGETGGTAAQDYFGLADKYLADAIAIDAYKNPEEFIYRVP